MDLETKGLFWINNMYFKHVYEFHPRVCGYPFITEFQDKHYALIDLAFDNCIRPMMLEDSLQEHQDYIAKVNAKYEYDVLNRTENNGADILSREIKRKRSSLVPIVKVIKSDKSFSNKVTEEQRILIKNYNPSDCSLKEFAKRLNLNYNTVAGIRHKYQ